MPGLQSIDNLNDLIPFVLKRHKAATTASYEGGAINTTPYVHPPGSQVASTGDSTPFFGFGDWRPRTIHDLQYLASACIPRFWRDDLYPDGYAGYTTGTIPPIPTIPADTYWTHAAMATALGYPLPPDVTIFSTVLWRRKHPRMVCPVYTYQTTVADLAGVTTARDRQGRPLGTCPPGALAQFYTGTGSPGLGSKYRGIVRHVGSGTWEPAPAGSMADVLDSSAGPWMGPGWCYPGPYVTGDYFGPWLWEDVRAAAEKLRWTWYAMQWFPDTPAMSPTEGMTVKTADASNATQGGAVGDWSAAATHVNLFVPSVRFGKYTTASNGYGSGPNDFYMGTSNGRTGGIPIPADLSGTVEIYVEARRYDYLRPVDMQGVAGLVENQFALMDSRAAAPDANGRHYVNLWSVDDEPPNWGTPSYPTDNRGFAVTTPFGLVKWNF
ncbi:MAG: hypothetical protein JWO31_3635 [Phycisphaerales bacterium]|nr:hypothetical protein [Phycisphaerales bacterium]